ncbi:MAG: hypothetical protein K2X98_02970 [Alphaproteobacteria bacterium]|nr:hypothetical protein [Alphaproteobacteria bacterium]
MAKMVGVGMQPHRNTVNSLPHTNVSKNNQTKKCDTDYTNDRIEIVSTPSLLLTLAR